MGNPTFLILGDGIAAGQSRISSLLDARFVGTTGIPGLVGSGGATNTATKTGLEEAFIWDPFALGAAKTGEQDSTTKAIATPFTFTGAFNELFLGFTDDADFRQNNMVAEDDTWYGTTKVFGPEVSLIWNILNRFGEACYFIKCAVGGSTLTRTNQTNFTNPPHAGSGTDPNVYGWCDYNIMNSWSPSHSGHLFSAITEAFLNGPAVGVGASTITRPLVPTSLGGNGTTDRYTFIDDPKTWAAANSVTLDVRGIFMFIGTTDTKPSEAWRATVFEREARLFMAKLRTFIGANGLTDLQPAEIPFVWIEPHPTISTTTLFLDGAQPAVAQALRNVARDDLWSGSVDPSDVVLRADDIHPTAAGSVALGDLAYNEFLALLTDAQPSVREAGPGELTARPTLATIRTNVNAIYERNRVTNDFATADVNTFINRAQRWVIQQFGDMNQIMRVREVFTWSANFNEPINLPFTVRRLHSIVDTDRPHFPIQFQLIGYIEGGKPQILVGNRSTSGRYTVEYSPYITDMTLDTDRSILPVEFQELLEVSTARRMARQGTDKALQASLDVDQNDLLAQAKQHMLLYERQRNVVMTNVVPIVTRSPHAVDTNARGYIGP